MKTTPVPAYSHFLTPVDPILFFLFVFLSLRGSALLIFHPPTADFFN
jgi:hypothetical protein